MVLDVSLTDCSDTDDNKSNASDSESEFDLSNPEAGVAMDDDEIFVSIHNYLSQFMIICLKMLFISPQGCARNIKFPRLIGHNCCLKWH